MTISTQGMRARFTKALVRLAGRWWDASYAAYVRCDRDGFPGWYQRPWRVIARKVDAATIPLACHLDGDAAAEQMVEEGWWG